MWESRALGCLEHAGTLIIMLAAAFNISGNRSTAKVYKYLDELIKPALFFFDILTICAIVL